MEDFKLALFLEKMGHFLRNMDFYSSKQSPQDLLACLLRVSQVGIYWKQVE